MNWQKRGWFALALLALMGCGEEESVEVIELPQDLDAMISIADAAVDPPDAVILPADAQVMRDGGPADSSLIQFESCEDVCDHYANCQRLDLWPLGRDQCLIACAEAETSPRYNDYIACLQSTTCANLDACVVPTEPRPECPAVCEALGACGADARVPAGLPGFDGCATSCENRVMAQNIVECGAEYVESPETCDEPTFARCLLTERSQNCVALCDRRAECEPDLDVIDCAIACAQPPASEDPVAQRRERIAQTCARMAETCEELAACGERTGRTIEGDASIDDLCAANEVCGFLSREDCPQVAETLLLALAPGAIDCLTDHFTNRCEEAPFACLEQAPVPNTACSEWCAVGFACGLLPPGQLEIDCLPLCRAALDEGDEAVLADLRPRLACAYGNTCQEIEACVAAGDPAGDCQGTCARRAECEVGDDATCLQQCRERTQTRRGWAEQVCTLAAGECAGVALCDAPEPPDCGRLCDLVGECGVNRSDCIRRCDDAHFARPESYLETLSCVASTTRCDERRACLEGEGEGGVGCLAYCRRAIECGGSEADYADCVVECATGLPGEEGLRYQAAQACLEAAGADAECAVLDDCFENVDLGMFCDGFCEEQSRCLLVEDGAACADACRAALENAETIEQMSCVFAAIRRDAGCGAVAECVGAEFEPASEACQSLCATRNACDPAIDAFLCERMCIPEPAGTAIRATCAELGDCDSLPLCLDAPAAIPPACAAACGAVEACEAIVGGAGALFSDRADCETNCAARTILEGEEFPAKMQQCADENMCDADAFVECLDRGPLLGCDDAWAAFTACNLTGFLMVQGEAEYMMVCQDAFMMDPDLTQRQIDCVVEVGQRANGDPVVCFEQLGCLFMP